MRLKRRDFLKLSAGGGMLLAAAGPTTALADSEKRPRSREAVGILYDSTLCIGCQACMSGCKEANDMPLETLDPLKRWDNPPDLSATTLNIIKRYADGNAATKNQEQDGYAFVKRQCLHCVDPACVAACPVSALVKDGQSGVVSYNKDACIGCRYCQIACPFSVPKFQWQSAFPEIVKCQLCDHLMKKGKYANCCATCPTGASLFGPVAELMTEAKRRLQLKPGTDADFPLNRIGAGPPRITSHKVGQYVQHLYGENEAGGTQVMFLAGVPFAKLGLPSLPEDVGSLTAGIRSAMIKGTVYPLALLGALVYLVRRGDAGDKENKG